MRLGKARRNSTRARGPEASSVEGTGSNGPQCRETTVCCGDIGDLGDLLSILSQALQNVINAAEGLRQVLRNRRDIAHDLDQKLSQVRRLLSELDRNSGLDETADAA